MSAAAVEAFGWTTSNKKHTLEMWVGGKSGAEIARFFGRGLTRSAVIGFVSREGKKWELATGKNPYARPDAQRNLKGTKTKAPKPPKITKPPQVKRVIDFAKVTPGDPLPPLVKLDERLWISLPNTTPKDLLSLGRCECRWPLSTGVDELGIAGSSHLFCGAKQADDSSYCKTHRSWSLSKKPLAPLNFGKAA